MLNNNQFTPANATRPVEGFSPINDAPVFFGPANAEPVLNPFAEAAIVNNPFATVPNGTPVLDNNTVIAAPANSVFNATNAVGTLGLGILANHYVGDKIRGLASKVAGFFSNAYTKTTEKVSSIFVDKNFDKAVVPKEYAKAELFFLRNFQEFLAEEIDSKLSKRIDLVKNNNIAKTKEDLDNIAKLEENRQKAIAKCEDIAIDIEKALKASSVNKGTLNKITADLKELNKLDISAISKFEEAELEAEKIADAKEAKKFNTKKRNAFIVANVVIAAVIAGLIVASIFTFGIIGIVATAALGAAAFTASNVGIAFGMKQQPSAEKVKVAAVRANVIAARAANNSINNFRAKEVAKEEVKVEEKSAGQVK